MVSSWTSGEIRKAVADVPGLETVVIGPNAPTEEGGVGVAAQVAAAGVTGVLAYNDLVAIGLIEAWTSWASACPATSV